jgi:hypothetical protein
VQGLAVANFRQYALRPGQHIEVEVVQANGGRALVAGRLDAVPLIGGRQAMRIRVRAALVMAIEAENPISGSDLSR